MASFLIFYLLITTLTTIVRSQETPTATDPSYYYNLCAPSTCGNFSLPYPFNLPTPCRPPTIKTFCSNNQSFHATSSLSTTSFKFLSMNLTDPFIYTFTLALESLFNCSAQVSKPYWNFGDGVAMFSLPYYVTFGTHFNCTAPIPPGSVKGLQNASCLECQGQNTSNFCYYSPGYLLSPNCESTRMWTHGPFNASSVKNLRAFMQLGFDVKYAKSVECHGCEVTGGRCGANPVSGSFVCFCPSSVHILNCTGGMINISTWANVMKRGGAGISLEVVAAISVSASVLVAGLLVALAVMLFRRRKYKFGLNNETLRSISPTRYSTSQLKKFTDNFALKLGEGGFGSVYKGEIHRGGLKVPVAIKILKRSRQTKKQFMNEVGTIGSIHHHNLVSMLGYCVEDDTHALVYAFMENGSLDKYIYKCNNGEARLSSRQIRCIALEIAKGILYLHRGCSNTILHLDIKPANVLLDSKFTAKVSDFGLAKMIDKDHSHVSLTQGQGTPGYAAPEMWLKTHGPVTEKSDVYSYGMLLLEMVGHRKNYESGASGSSQVYFPEWLYKNIEPDELPLIMSKTDGDDAFEIVRDGEGNGEEDEKAMQRMCLVGLWCIQHIPSKRPWMNEVVKMLEGVVHIVMPPDPFLHNTTVSH